ncbi:protein N-terminal amidase, partial [Tremellales sp. Uapishka_1]
MSTPIAPPSRDLSPAPLYRRAPLGKVEKNKQKVEEMTNRLRPGTLDLLVLPEMALSGYMFSDPTSILPYLEEPRIGPTSLLARSLARRLECHVIAGYPEAIPPGTPEEGTSGKEVAGEGSGVGWNSAVVVDPTGEVVGNYRKTFRFETDKNWARKGERGPEFENLMEADRSCHEGDGFQYFDLAEPLGRVAVGICMDMNPKDFLAPFDAYELANFCRDNSVDMLVVPMNWLDPPAEPPNVAPEQDPEAPSEHNLNYWVARLSPLHDPTPGYSSTSTPTASSSAKEIVFVGCNRVGEEEGTKFIGTSCVMTISSSPSRIELVECSNITEERVMITTVS